MKKSYLSWVIAVLLLLNTGLVCGDVVINEIMQNPSAVLDDYGEYIELYNSGDSSVDIDGWTLEDLGSDSRVIDNGGSLVISSKGYVVLCRNSDYSENGGVNCDYEHGKDFVLSNGDDEVILLNGSGSEVDKVEYDDGATFPDPDGASMELIDPSLDNNDGSNWREATVPYGDGDKGTPGEANEKDTTAPLITDLTRTPEIVYNDNDADLSANITDANLDSVWISGDWEGDWVNKTVTSPGDVYTYNIDENYLENQQIVHWKYYAEDSLGNVAESALQSFTVANRDPILLSDVIIDSWDEDKNKTVDISANFEDPDGDELTLSVETYPANIGVLKDEIKGEFTLVPNNDFFGENTIIFKAEDPYNGINYSNEVTLTVDNVNDPPYFTTSPADLTAIEAIEYTYDADADDIDSDELNFSIVDNRPSGADIDAETGEFTWIPDDSHVGIINEVKLEVKDQDGASSTQDFNITVLPVLDIIDIIIEGKSVEDGDTVEGIAPGDILDVTYKVKNRFPDEPNNAIVNIKTEANISKYSSLGKSANGIILEGQETKFIDYDFHIPYTADVENFSIVMEVKGIDLYDNSYSSSKEIHLLLDRDFHRVKITGKKWSEDDLTCGRETSLNITLANTGDYNETGTITVYNEKTETNKTEPFSLDIAKDQEITFEINATQASNDESFYITVKYRYDYYVIEDSVKLEISDCFDIAGLEAVAKMDEDSASSWDIDLKDYTYDTDVSYRVISTNASILKCYADLDGDNFSCDKPLKDNWNGVLPINLTITKGPTVTKEQFDVTVNAVNDEPLAYPVSAEVNEDSSVVIALNCSDIDKDSLSYIIVDGPENGTLSGTRDSRTYRPDADYYSADSFTYKCNDGTVDSDTATVSIEVHSVLDEPSISDFSPKDGYLLIGDGVTKPLSITIDDPDEINPTVKWYVDGNYEPNGTTKFDFIRGASGTHKVTVNVTNASETESYGKKTWNIRVTETPVTYDYTGTIANVPKGEVSNYSSLTIVKSGVAMIDFRGTGIDLSEVIDVDANVRIEKGVVGINSNADGFDVFKDKEAIITMYGLSSSSAPTIYYNDGFETTGTNICDKDSYPSCTEIEYNANTGALVFKVSHFTMFFLNMPPTITSTPRTTAVQDELYQYDVQAIDPENDALAYSLTTKPSGMSINSVTGLITWTPANITEEDVIVMVTDGTNTVNQSFKIKVEEPNRLRISDLDVKVGDETAKDLQNGDKIKEKARPGDTVKFDIEIENLFPSSADMMIEDIEVVVTIENIDDDDDLEEDADIDEIDAGKDESVTLEFEIPTLVDEGDYNVMIDISGEDEDGNEHNVNWDLTLEVKKNKHDLLIYRADLTPSTVKCSRNPALDIEVINIGTEDEDEVAVEIKNNDLGIDIETKDIELEEGNDDDAVFERTYRFVVDDDVKAGTYPIEIKALYDSKTSDEATVNLIVEDCADITTPLEGEPVEVVIKEPEIKEPTAPVTEISFRESSEYLTLLIILFVILGGGVIFLIGGTIILMKKKR